MLLEYQVVIPADAGFVSLTEDTVIATLEMNGGALVTHDSTCLSGWSPPPGGTSASFGTRKCYRVFRDPKPWAGAQSACAFAVGARKAGLRGGALRGALVTVQGLEENQWVQRLCRGGDCWVGMTRNYNSREAGAGATDLEWADLEVGVGDSRYRSWARWEPATFLSGKVRAFPSPEGVVQSTSEVIAYEWDVILCSTHVHRKVKTVWLSGVRGDSLLSRERPGGMPQSAA